MKTRRTRPNCCLFFKLVALLTLFWFAGSWAAEERLALKSAALNVGFTEAAFLHVNRNDVEAAFKVLALTVGRNRGYDLSSENHVIEGATAFERALESGEINMAIFDMWTYLSKDFSQLVDPEFVGAESGETVGNRFVVLTRKDSGLNSLAGLRNKDFAELEAASATMGRFWLETLLLKEQLGTHKTFFRRTESVGKASAAVLPVFFGNKHACLVNMSGFTVMDELNPQVGNRLQIVATSPVLVDAVICLNRSGWTPDGFKEDLIEALAELHLEPEGQQILNLFKAVRLVQFHASFLDTARELRMDYEKLHNGSKP